MSTIDAYIAEIRKYLSGKIATEHTYRPALQTLVQGLKKKITVTNEPKRIRCGAPDFIVTAGHTPLGYIEAKDVGVSLDKEEASEQMARYLPSLANLVLTDYVEFRWYVNGKPRISASLGSVDTKGVLHIAPGGAGKVEELLTAFLNADVPVISSPKELASRMAAVARLIRGTIDLALAEEKESGTLHQQMKGFREVLLHDLTPQKFADMYAQTIAYGLFSARANSDPGKRFTREHAAYDLPKTNPFLRQMFGHIAGPDLEDPIVWVVDDLAELLHRANMSAVLADFGKRTKRQDPVLHFYETFLAEYNPRLREQRGVYYTPEPVVDYIVHSVDHVLRKSFGLKGLSDPAKISIKNPHGKGKLDVHKVLVLDPAVGTGTFLHGVVDHIHDTISAKNKGMWSGYVSSHLLPRLFGFELLMAPYAVAHMKLGLQLAETGYDFATDERLRVYLTNTLEEAHALSKMPLFSQWIAEEANAANLVKQDAPVMVILGNPPYSGHSSNTGDWITALIEDYKKIDGKKIRLGQGKWLQNDYVKFIRFAQHRIEQTGYGVLAMITDHSYIDSGTFVGMRANLQEFFDDIYVLDLQGNAKRNKNRSDPDQNVFDITQGVAIIVAVKREGAKSGPGTVHTATLRGSRAAKYKILAESSISKTIWEVGNCRPPYYLFASTNASHLKEYESLPSIADILPGTYGSERSKRIGTGFVSTHDDFAIAFSKSEMTKKVERFLATADEEEARREFALCGQEQWNYAKAKAALKTTKWRDEVRSVLYRPFDERVTVWNPNVCVHRRLEVNKHLKGDNLALLVGQAGNVIGAEEWALAFVTRRPADFNVFYRGGSAVLPMLLSNEDKNHDLFSDDSDPSKLRANLDQSIADALQSQLKLSFDPLGPGGKKGTFSAADVFGYIYAILYSPTYRARYGEFLMVDFPRIPFTRDPKLFKLLAHKGNELISLHLQDSAPGVTASFPVKGSDVVEYIKYVAPIGKKSGRVYINPNQYFDDVAPTTWEFEIGGYQVCHKWLKDRKGLELSFDDLAQYQVIVGTIDATGRTMAEIDATVEEHGGWPIKPVSL